MLSLLQFSDGLFPAGAFAHSFGLETYVQSGEVRDADGAEKFVRAHLAGSVATVDAVAAVNAMHAARARGILACVRIDEILDAMKPAAELRAASRQLGRQTLRIAAALLLDPLTAEFSQLADEDRTPCHHAVVYGIAGAAQGWGAEQAAIAYLYSSSAAVTAAAVRLIPLGQLQGQRIIRSLMPSIAALAGRATQTGIAEMTAFAPALEIAAMRHERLEARLFRS